MVFTTEPLLEVAIESWLEWDLNPQPLSFVQTLLPTKPSGHEFNLHSEPTLQGYSNFMFCSVSDFISAIDFVSFHVCFNQNFVEIITEFRSDALTD